ncbi:hypothetical protein DCAR_0933327 [Daucus carota subsp. sativus]|uniref:Uncharacterized protein n=1 Tax=Daucus carota subsp. sativus TaxID=79200 RepID=A0AAF0XWN1_DAUCS|nr:hypothetical protein DCAR_0933327 [Daucus carota subsp. sativus]
MSQMVSACMREVAKLKDKMQVNKSFLFRNRCATEVSPGEQGKEGKTASLRDVKSSVEAKGEDGGFSEATIFMIMDRFAPS